MTKRPMLTNPFGRSTPEWIGKTPDEVVPEHVQLRVLFRQGRNCAISGVEIRPGDSVDCDHIVELILGGENRESNLQIVLRDPHKAKTAAAKGIQAKADAVAKKAYGITKPKQTIKSAGFAPPAKVRTPKEPLKPRQLYEDV